MRTCQQSAGQNVLEHGIAVHQAAQPIFDHASHGTPLPDGFRAPSWLIAGDPMWTHRLPSIDALAPYHVYHDCGKPLCRTVDENGRRHFPNHAAVSQRTWLAHGGDEATGLLIAMDMDAHLLSADESFAFAQRPQSAILLLTALAELHANAAMFGGIASDGFKIKFKRLEQRGKTITKAWRETDALNAKVAQPHVEALASTLPTSCTDRCCTNLPMFGDAA